MLKSTKHTATGGAAAGKEIEMKYAVVTQYDCGLGERGTIVSTHKSYELARSSARRSGCGSFLAIREMPTSQEQVSAAASAMGRKGGSVKSEAKTAAVRENGKKGGRPRKQQIVG